MHHFLVAGILFLGTTSINAQNLVINPGFENGGSTNPYLAPWTTWYGTGSSAYRSGASPYAGTYCGTVKYTAEIKQLVSLTENTNYILRAKFRAILGSVSVGVRNYSVSDASDLISVSTTSTGWVETGDIAFKTGVGNTSATILVFTSGTGNQGSGDDFSVTLDVSTGLNQTSIKSNVYSINSEIIIEGSEGHTAVIYSITGQSVKSVLLASNYESFVAKKGFYIVKIGTQNFKLMIK